jgi:hypothetical protein
MLLSCKASSSAVIACAASAIVTASTSALAAASFVIVSLAAVGLLPVLCARGDRALRLSFGHDALVGGCRCCSFVEERRDDQGQPVFLLSAENRGMREKKRINMRCLCFRIK